jgi:hypothetical protein
VFFLSNVPSCVGHTSDRGQRSDRSPVIYEQRLRHVFGAAANQCGTSPSAMTSRLWYPAVLCDALVAGCDNGEVPLGSATSRRP